MNGHVARMEIRNTSEWCIMLKKKTSEKSDILEAF
jgi:hypothetical protein